MFRSGHRARATLALLSALSLVVAAGATSAYAVTPIAGGPLTVFSGVDIDLSSGDQYDPHVNGDLAVYTAPDGIRFYDFALGSNVLVTPAVDSVDQLSDVSDGQIVYSRLSLIDFSVKILVFNTLTSTITSISPSGPTQHSNGAIGSNTVAYIDTGINLTGELYAGQIGSASIRVTNDGRYDQAPQIAPSGDLIVYESCETTQANCDVRQAAWNGSSWVVTALTTNAEPESNPDTDGVRVVYDATRSGERGIYWQPAGGGAEQHVELAGLQRNPSVNAGVIAFESVAVGDSGADLFVYEISTNRLFQITSTPADETLNDVSVLADGRVRVVWSSGGMSERDIYGATFELPPAGPSYTFGGFLAPVDAHPTLNSVKAGAAVPVKFSLGGDEGLGIFASGYPKAQAIACDSSAQIDPIEQTVTAGGSSLTYDPVTDTYSYVWKTDKAWKGTCRQLVLGFADGSFQRANFMFK